MDADDRNNQQANQVDSDGSLVHGASRAGEEDVHDDCHDNGSKIHGQGRTDQERLPELGVSVLDLLQTVLSPTMSQVDQENETKKQEQDSADQSDIVAPDDEEAIRNQEGNDNETDPGDQLGSPEAVLNSRSLVACVLDADEQQGHDEMEEAESEVDTVDSGEAIACLAVAGDCSEIEQDMLEFLDGPVGEHDP